MKKGWVFRCAKAKLVLLIVFQKVPFFLIIFQKVNLLKEHMGLCHLTRVFLTETGSRQTASTTTQSGYLTLRGDLPHWPAISGLCCVCFWVSLFLWTYSAFLRGRSPSRKIPFLEGGRRGLPTEENETG